MPDLIAEINALEKRAAEQIAAAADANALQKTTQEFIGKKGVLTVVMKQLGTLSNEERGAVGKAANAFKVKLEELLAAKEASLAEAKYASLAETEFIDLSFTPPEFAAVQTGSAYSGHVHPIAQTQKKLEDIFTSMGFSIVDGPQIEDDYHNFGALNFTDDHPARDMQDTFYVTHGGAQQATNTTAYLLRTHTSSVQIRALEKMQPPLRIIAPGRVFRYEEVDASHEHTFYQMEGMIIDRHISVGNLLHLMQTLLTEVFGRKVEVRLRPGYFPFVEPGFELDMKCLVCESADSREDDIRGGATPVTSVSTGSHTDGLHASASPVTSVSLGCSVCKYSGWVEVLPCGLVHPNVLRNIGVNPSAWQGAAFGLGLNRLVMMQHGIEDIRHFMSGKLSFLRQF
ncbi:MAG TPA: phenylalanine--tRNA ligase subunit alpha [Turneriella sp.]|nr:phenylalanine--tRNA ligase subunit alpha [Turneriella sp.]